MSRTDPSFEVLREAFTEVFQPNAPGTFGSGPLRIMGLHDGNHGVQWNTWIEWDNPQTSAAFLGVNLEGMKYDGWPIARLIQQELRDPWLFDAKERVADPQRVRIALHRHAWQGAGRVPNFLEQWILPRASTLADLTPEMWLRSLLEAQQCLATSEGGRANRRITLKDGRQVQRAVSPYLNFHTEVRIEHDQQASLDALNTARDNLQPLYDFVLDRCSNPA